MSAERIPVERFQPGDKVRAVERGPVGIVIRIDGGWTTVRYPLSKRLRRESNAGMIPYKHGADGLYSA